MGLFHCPLGAVCYEAEDCIRCGLCLATSREEAVAASKKLREHLRTQGSARQRRYLIQKILVCGKGGVGKSTITTLLASSLQAYGYRVLVVDTDESNPGLCRTLGFDWEPAPLVRVLDRFDSGAEGAQAWWMGRESLALGDIPPEFLLERDGLRFMMAGKIEDPFQGCACSMGELMRNLMLRLRLADREIAVIDQEAGVESFGRGVERGIDTVLAVVEPSLESLRLAERIRYMAEGIGVGRVRAVLNKVPSAEVEERLIEELIKREIKFLGAVYADPAVSAAGLDGRPLWGSAAEEQVKTIARLMLDEAEMKYGR